MADDKKSAPAGGDADHKVFDNLEKQAKALADEQEFEQSLQHYTKVLEYKKKTYGANGSEFTATMLEVCKIANLHALDLLRRGNLTDAKIWLERSEELAEGNNRCTAITMNNQACYYKKLGLNRSALIKLEQALELEGNIEDASFKADTHLNICAVLSQMNRHELAMNHAQSAIITVQARLLMTFLPIKKSDMKKKLDGTDELREEIQDQFKDNISILCVSYHNLAVEQEFLKMYPEAIESYNQARSFALNYLGKGDGIYENLEKTCLAATQDLKKQIAKQKERAVHRNPPEQKVSVQKKAGGERAKSAARMGRNTFSRTALGSQVSRQTQGFVNHSRKNTNINKQNISKVSKKIDLVSSQDSPPQHQMNNPFIQGLSQKNSMSKMRNSYQGSGNMNFEGGSNSSFQMYNSNVGLLNSNHFSMLRPTRNRIINTSPSVRKPKPRQVITQVSSQLNINDSRLTSGNMSMFDNFMGT